MSGELIEELRIAVLDMSAAVWGGTDADCKAALARLIDVWAKMATAVAA